ncbi:MAG: hypothetical protein JST54_27380 [Deltaproteobacteria bacterium]|nr:hypothetical protein [Deltaproteobacteria bacterium]
MEAVSPSSDGRRPRPPAARVLSVIIGTSLLHATLVVAARRGLVPNVVLAGLGLGASVLVGAVGEWLVHRFLMHRRWRPPLLRAIYDLHHRGHHFIHYTPARYVHDGPINYIPVWPPQPAVMCDSAWSRVLSMGAQWLFYGTVAAATVVLPTALLAENPWFTASFCGGLAVELWLFVRMHDAVHYPGQSALEKLPFFGFLDRHHYLHHLDTEANTNFLLPLGDWLMGTLRTRATIWEQAHFPSYVEARSRKVQELPLAPPTEVAEAA